MNTLCEVLEDRPNTFEELKSGLTAHGFTTRLTKNTATFANRINDLPDDLAGWLVDNHIDKCPTLKDFGRSDITTNGGAEAGLKIVSDIMIPKMRQGLLPMLPLGLMSAHDIRRAEAAFRNRYDDEFPNVYFVEKPRTSDETPAKIQYYLDALEKVANFDLETPEGTVQVVRTKMLRQAAANLGLNDKDVARLLRVRPNTNIAKQLADGEIHLDTAAWEEMAVVLFEIDVALSNAFSENPDTLAEERHWLLNYRVGRRGERPRDMLLTGEFEAAYRVLDAATFLAEGRDGKEA